jgi:hypothetical protein
MKKSLSILIVDKSLNSDLTSIFSYRVYRKNNCTHSMGQYFQVSAPRARRALRKGGKLQAILFDGTPTALVHVLAVPIEAQLPSSSSPDSTLVPTEPQYTLPAIDVVTSGPAEDHLMVHSRQRKRQADDEALGQSLQPKKKLETASSDFDKGGEARFLITFSGLPTEMHELIFARLESIEDLICLSVTSRYFWGIGYKHIRQYYTSLLGCWAGQNIVCVGDYVDAGDYPPNLFSAEEEQELNQMKVGSDGYCLDSGADSDSSADSQWLTLYDLAIEPIGTIEEVVDLYQISTRTLYACMRRCRSKEWTFDFRHPELVMRNSTYFPNSQVWILRNLTTKEFVLPTAVALKPEYIDGPFIRGLGFGEVVMARTCWTSDYGIAMSCGTGICRGVWAGHRFDITTLSRHNEETKGEKWRDVSEDVSKEIAHIWQCEDGPNWRERIYNTISALERGDDSDSSVFDD